MKTPFSTAWKGVVFVLVLVGLMLVSVQGLLAALEPPTFVLQWYLGDNEMEGPYGIAVDGDNNVWVTQIGQGAVAQYDGEGTTLLWFEVTPTVPAEYLSPAGIYVDNNGDIYVTVLSTSQVLKYDSNGALLTSWGSFGSGQGEFGGPFDIVVSASGEVYVTDPRNNRIQVFDSDYLAVLLTSLFLRQVRSM